MSSPLRIALLLALVCVAHAASAEPRVHVYRPLSRPAAELLGPAEAALGAEGSVALDPGTNALVLIGEPAAVDAALAVLGELDRPLASFVLHYASERLADLETRGVRVAWSVAAGDFRVGNVHAPPGVDLVALRASAEQGERRSRLAGVLRVQDGQSGWIETGSELPIVERVSPFETQLGFVRASSGFEARPQRLGDGRVRVAIAPFEGALQPGGGIEQRGAATEVTVRPGDTVAIGGLTRSETRSTRGLAGAADSERHEDWLLLLRVEVEGERSGR